MTYKDYSARIEYSDEDACFIGHVAGIRDVVGFHGESVTELRAAFEEAVDDYLATCEKLKRAPQRPYSGKVMLRIDPGIHAKVAMLAEAQGKSINAWAQEALQRAVSASN
jgi:predicted HicB family RNase H-like nuclease